MSQKDGPGRLERHGANDHHLVEIVVPAQGGPAADFQVAPTTDCTPLFERHREARQVLKDAIVSAGLPTHVGTVILAAADRATKFAVITALAERAAPEPARGGAA